MHTLTPTPSDAPLQAIPIDISFSGNSGRMIGLGFINGVLKVLTLGLYSFWAKTEVRRRIWSAVRLNSEPLSYTGTGKELFLGFLIVFAAVILPVMAGAVIVSLLYAGNKQALGLYQGILYIGFFLVVGNAIYRAQRYRLSRTEWRGIRGALAGSPGAYSWTYFWTLAAPFAAIALLAGIAAKTTGPSVGGIIILIGFLAVLWVLPWRANKLQSAMINDMRFGDRPLSYSGTAGPLYKRYLFAWLGNALIFAAAIAATAVYMNDGDRYISWYVLKVPPTLPEILTVASIWFAAIIASAVVTSWYRASQMNHFARNTHFEGATFRGEAAGSSLMWLVLSNWLLTIVGLLVGVAIGGLLVYVFGANSTPPPAPEDIGEPSSGRDVLAILLVMPPIIVMTTLTATFAQFRSARYFLSRLKLDGPINLGAILQSQHTGPKRGEGLAQAFDIDAF